MLRSALCLLALFSAPFVLIAQDDSPKKSGAKPKAEPTAGATEVKPEAGIGATPPPTTVTPLAPSDLRNFERNPPAVRALIERSLALTTQHLGYKFGSSDPANGGMDCSGTIYYVLRAQGLTDVPRTASGQYVWTRKADRFEPVISRDKESFELDALRPGDLLFWTGTYSTKNDPPVTHTMIYLGELKADGRQVMFGASDGRSYGGEKMWGVSAFDFKLPKPAAKGEGAGSVFIGYAKIPGLTQTGPPPDPSAETETGDGEKVDSEGNTPAPKKGEEPAAPPPAPSPTRKPAADGPSSRLKPESTPAKGPRRSAEE